MRNQVLFGDSLEILKTLPDELVQCCVTSPPYWGGLRDYDSRKWFDETLPCDHDQLIEHGPHHPGQVEETKWKSAKASGAGQNAVTYSCSKCGAWYGQLGQEPKPEQYVRHLVEIFEEVRRVLRDDGCLWVNIGDGYFGQAHEGRKNKDLVGMPWMVAFALQAAGWWLRSEVIWHKTNAKPESVEDRPVRSHEHIFLFVKSERYFYDSEAVLEFSADARQLDQGYRSRRDVWSIPYEPFEGAHFAVFPTEIPRVCILASTSPNGACRDCGKPWRWVEELYLPDCRCGAPTEPCIVLDPFMGSGTTAAVARKLKRDYLGIELNPGYGDLIEQRIMELNGVPAEYFAKKGVGKKGKKERVGDEGLFDWFLSSDPNLG